MDPYNSAGAHLPRQPPELPPANPYAAPTARIADLRSDTDFAKASRGAVLSTSTLPLARSMRTCAWGSTCLTAWVTARSQWPQVMPWTWKVVVAVLACME